MTPEIITVVGPTACGKTRVAVGLARLLGGEVISGDSRQVYRGMTIGTGKDLDEYGDIPAHLLDIVHAGEKYNLHRFLSDFHAAFDDVRSRGRMPVLCGGSGLYVETAISGVVMPEVPQNPELRSQLEGKSLDELESILRQYKTLHNTTDIDTPKRAIRAIEIQQYYADHPEESTLADRRQARQLQSYTIGLDISRELRRERISQRLRARLDEGMIDEIKALLQSGIAAEDLIYYGLEYKYVTLYVTGRLSYEEMYRQLEIAIHQFAKRQMTWFRGMERRGFPIHWIPFDTPIDQIASSIPLQ